MIGGIKGFWFDSRHRQTGRLLVHCREQQQTGYKAQSSHTAASYIIHTVDQQTGRDSEQDRIDRMNGKKKSKQSKLFHMILTYITYITSLASPDISA